MRRAALMFAALVVLGFALRTILPPYYAGMVVGAVILVGLQMIVRIYRRSPARDGA